MTVQLSKSEVGCDCDVKTRWSTCMAAPVLIHLEVRAVLLLQHVWECLQLAAVMQQEELTQLYTQGCQHIIVLDFEDTDLTFCVCLLCYDEVRPHPEMLTKPDSTYCLLYATFVSDVASQTGSPKKQILQVSPLPISS